MNKEAANEVTAAYTKALKFLIETALEEVGHAEQVESRYGVIGSMTIIEQKLQAALDQITATKTLNRLVEG